MRRERGLDALRGLSALAVVIGHTSYQMRSGAVGGPVWLVIAHLGSLVYLFFALSGYLIAGPWVRSLLSGAPLPTLSHYFIRRASRILPLYVLVLGFMAVAEPEHWSNILLHLVFLQNIVPGENALLHNGVMWTLGIEVTFYLCVPLVAHAVRRLHPAALPPRTVGLALVLVACASGFLFGIADSAWSETFPVQVCFFMPGLLVAVAEFAHWSKPDVSKAVLAGGLLWLVELLLSPEAQWVTAPLAIAAAWLWVGAAVGSHPSRLLVPLASMGTISYGVYLIHAQLLGRLPVFSVVTPLTYLEAVTLLLGSSIALATVSWLLLERPILRLSDPRRRHPAEAALSAAAV